MPAFQVRQAVGLIHSSNVVTIAICGCYKQKKNENERKVKRDKELARTGLIASSNRHYELGERIGASVTLPLSGEGATTHAWVGRALSVNHIMDQILG